MVERSSGVPFKVEADFNPAGDQPQAIRALVAGLEDGIESQVLLGASVDDFVRTDIDWYSGDI